MELQDVREKLKRRNRILFSRESECVQELLKLLRVQKHRTIVMWAFECVQIPLQILKEHYPEEERPHRAVALCKEWAAGKIKMPIAKKALLQVHAMAKEIENDIDQSLCHAVGHACATVHVETHAIGLPIYELTAIVHKYGIDHCEKEIEKKMVYYIKNLKQWEKKIDVKPLSWAKFLMDDNRPNKEQILFEKKQKKEENTQ